MRTGAVALVFAAAACSSWSACVRTAPAPSPAPTAPPPVRVPPGCERNLSGSYVHALNETFRYEATDDGATLVLRVVRGPSDAGTPNASSAQEIVLTRSAEGFKGATRGTAFPPGGKPCPVEFPTELTACPDDGLVLLAAEEISVHALSCERAAAGARPAMVEQRLVRSPPGGQAPAEGDAGVPPAGGADGGT